MTTWMALFRGINVGGNNILPMAELRIGLESLKLRNVRTYIQSGNVVFASSSKSAAALARKIADHVEQRHGFRPQVLLLTYEDLADAVEKNPFPKAVSDPKTLHFTFLAEPATDPDLAALDAVKSATEEYALTDHVFYLHAPDGIGRSKLAANAEKILGVTMTGRNFRTVEKLMAIAAADG